MDLRGNVDAGRIAGNAKDYTVVTPQTFGDVLLNLPTGIASIHSRTVMVTR